MTPEEQRKIVTDLGWGGPEFADLVYKTALAHQTAKDERGAKEERSSNTSEE